MELSAEDRQLIGSSDLSDAGEVSDNTVNALLESPQPATDQPSVDPQPTSQNSSEPAQGITGRVAHLPDQSGITPQPSRGTKRTALEPNPRVEPEDGAHATSFNPSSSDSDDDDETIDVVGIGATPNRAALTSLLNTNRTRWLNTMFTILSCLVNVTAFTRYLLNQQCKAYWY